ncbi:DUF3304 domain-containing protein [Cronobacter sakazakii]|uniref:DUF3304 domain-containing protein n=1 Tax=Cronobacter sakazakii TaxID=28141 RepID=UPI000CFCC16B|nr:DUF3304 domain-containing protein [Cronobacter sakazakii]ELY2470640.1 DUF3304 domain-containing protein [Cronobacter sakazakii]ELY3412147.1 DUF3304 domain-containing protein [Cronobacter sakazakii]ELY4419137.1 DUF3304 domain-containing protein [Cronobacter sakazakii]ELY4749781.1 DUF3304 domain-containing protein [Cronobacter sakazakii]ELY5778053.1 DUF3304 domain-containing protein [Cronobacter sakazakii]
MELYNLLKRADSELTQLYARRKHWLWGFLLTPFILMFAWTFWVANWGETAGGVTLIIHSRLDRPVLGFSVNGVAGGNASAYGEGATTCCGSIQGPSAEVIWTLSVTGPQYEAGMRPEKHRVVLPLPERKRGENDLHVHFLPGDKVLLGWSDNAWSPYDKNNPKFDLPGDDKE